MTGTAALLPADATREEWLKARENCVCATEVAAILGLHPFETPRTVYESKKGLRDKAQTEAMWLGTELEPFIAAMFAKRYGAEEGLELGKDIVKAGFYVHPERPRHGATPDYLLKEDGLLECKWAGFNASFNFGPSDTDEVPTYYLIQCQWQMHVTGRKYVQLALLTGAGQLKRFRINRDDELIRRAAFKVDLFIGEYIEGDFPPPLSGHEPDSEWVKNRFPEDSGAVVAASYELEETIAELGKKVLAARQADLDIEALKNRIKEFMGDASVLQSDEGRFTWKRSADSEQTDWKSCFEGLRAYCSMRGDAELICAEADRLKAELTKPKPGSRRFLMPWKGERA